ncbi:MAG: 16S rRNA (guanine(966)-N(2))-methyltransferase RsmD [Dehalococcoidia bacterium]|nr:MAG: 16S rRNA (guanine(966)-N(2))-methyltransferase RsmD [Dehalococcoidia bacterium]
MLRVIAGSARGVLLRMPPRAGTRPTSGRLREALFAMLTSAGADGSRVLDLYAGSGALGIEALSRWDGHATFLESDARAAAVVRENLHRTKFTDQADVVIGRAGRWRAAGVAPYTLVLADPPYDDAAAWAAIEHTVEGALAPDAMIVVEHDARQTPPETLAGRACWRDRRQGAGAVAIYRARAEEAA